MSRHVLMCEPVHFRIAYEINPWMHMANAVLGPRALEQWHGLRGTLEDLGVKVELVEQAPEVPDMTFTANAGLVIGKRFVPANFRFAERRAEYGYFVDWFSARGYAVEPIHEPHYWEGEGDVLAVPGDPATVLAGWSFRTEPSALDHLEAMLGTPLLRLELADERFYHLDTCLCPLGPGRALYFPPAFSDESRALIEATFPNATAVPEEDALRFACNALVVDDAVVLNTGCDATSEALAQQGFRPVATPTDEFIKAGGSVKCLVIQLDALGTGSEARG